MFDAYGGSAFPGIGDILYNINEQVKKYTNLNIIINKQSKKNTYLNIAAYWYIFGAFLMCRNLARQNTIVS